MSLLRCCFALCVLLLAQLPLGGQPAGWQGDAPPPEAALRMGSVRLRHASAVTHVAFSPDGRTLAAADSRGTVCFWDPATGSWRLELPQGTAYRLAFSPDGKVLAAGTNQEVCLRDPTTGEKRRAVAPTGRSDIHSFVFSPDGRTLAVAAGKEVVLCDAATGKETKRLRGHELLVHAVAFSPDGKWIASGDAQGRPPASFQQPGDTTIILWDAATGEELRRIKEAHHGWVSSLAFSGDGKLLAAASPYRVRIWSAESGQELASFERGGGAVAFSPKETRLATVGPLALHDPQNGRLVLRMEAAADAARSIAFSPDGTMLASGHDDGRVRLWDARSGKEVVRQAGHEQAVRAVAFSPDGRVVASASGGDQTVRVWGAATGVQLRKLRLGCTAGGHWCAQNDAGRLFFTPDGRTLGTWTCDGIFHLWELDTAREREFAIGQRWITTAALSPDGKALAVVCPDEVRRRNAVVFYDLSSGKEVQRLHPFGEKAGSEHLLTAIAFSPDGKVLAMGAHSGNRARAADRSLEIEDTVHLWDIAAGQPLRSFRQAELPPRWLLFTPDGQSLIASSTGNRPVQVWDVGSGKEVRRLAAPVERRPGYEADAIALSPDGKTLATTTGDNQIVLGEVGTGQEVRRLRGHAKAIRSLAFAPDGRSLLSGSEDATVLLWPVDAPPKAPEKPKQPDPGELEQAWNDLAAPDAPAAYRAIATLAAAPDAALAVLRRLKAAPARDPARLPRLIADLASAEAQVRAAAAAELQEYGSRAEPPLYEALRSCPAIEVRRELEQVLAAINERPILPEELRRRRAVQALERIGTPAAEQLLRRRADGAPSAEPTRDARLALERLRVRRTRKPVAVLSDEGAAAARQHLVGSREPRSLTGHAGSVAALAFAPDGKVLASAGGRDGDVRLWDTATGRLLHRLSGHAGGAHGLAFAPGGKILASAGADRSVRLWSVPDGRLVRALEGHTDQAVAVAFAPDGKTLASGGRDGTVRLWNVADGRLLHAVKADADRVTGLAFSPDGKLLAAGGLVLEQNAFAGGVSYSQPALIQLWTAADGKRAGILPVRGSDVAFAPDGRTLLAAGQFYLTERNHAGWAFITWGDVSIFSAGQIHWWDLARRKEVRSLQSHGGAIALSPDGKTLAAVAGHTAHHTPFMWGTNRLGGNHERGYAVRLLESLTGQEVLKGPPVPGSAVAFAPDGRTLAWGDEKGLVVLWDVMPAGPLARHPNGPAPDDLDRLWRQLADDAPAAYQAGWTLAAAKGAVAFLGERLRPALVEEKRLLRLIADLGSDEFEVRDRATRELEKFGTAAEIALAEAREKQLPPEALRRVDELLGELTRSNLPPDELRDLRAVWVLERIGSPEARKILERLSQGSPLARRTLEARQAKDRLAR